MHGTGLMVIIILTMSDQTNPEEAPLSQPSPKKPSVSPQYLAPWEKQAKNVNVAQQKAAQRADAREKRNRYRSVRKLRPWLIWGGLIYGVWAFYHPHGIFVFGDPLSVGRYRGVLKDLKTEMPEEYKVVRDHIDTIKISYIITGGNYAGYAQEGDRGTKKITLLENTFIKGPGYAHSTLVHEACHGLQFEKDLPFVPFCENQSREHACNQWGLRILRHFEAKPEMIAHYESIAEGKTVYGNSCLRDGSLKVMPEL